MKFFTNFLKVNFRFQAQDKRDDKFNRPIEMSLKFKLKMLYLKRDFENIIRNLFPQQQQNCTFTSTPSTERYFNKIRFTDLPQWQRRGAMRSKSYTLKASTRSKKKSQNSSNLVLWRWKSNEKLLECTGWMNKLPRRKWHSLEIPSSREIFPIFRLIEYRHKILPPSRSTRLSPACDGEPS